MSRFDEALEICRQARTSAGKGRRFEELIRDALDAHPGEYGPKRFEKLWLWDDWPGRHERSHAGDIGIDLVGKQTEDYGGGLCAIQCKLYDTARVTPTDVDKFLAASIGREWASRIFVATSDYTKPAETKLRKAPDTQFLKGGDMAAWPLDWKALAARPSDKPVFDFVKHEPRPDQERAIRAVLKGFETEDRGRMVMPCGTGKSVVAMWLSERMVGLGGRVLYLVPSISLMDQTMREWAWQQRLRHRYLGACSDTKVGRAAEDMLISELAMPATTDAGRIASEMKLEAPEVMRTLFCTYQSLEKIIEAQREHGCPGFDLVICDEAHRTTGVEGQGEGLFLQVHDSAGLMARKRLYMTATQRIYTEQAKKKARSPIHSMDDEQDYGPLMFEENFSAAVGLGLLTDYEVLVIAVAESHYGPLLGENVRNGVTVRVPDSDGKITTKTIDYQDAVKMLGCWDALACPQSEGVDSGRVTGQIVDGTKPCRKVIAFSNTIKSSKMLTEYWRPVVHKLESENERPLDLSAHHVDGKMNAFKRSASLEWLRDADASEDAVRILSNARCLGEGIDVPALDAVIFMAPKRSEVDIVQAVGRVMRKAPGKKVGYIVLPVFVPDEHLLSSESVLRGSDFKQVYKVLRALRSHDERFDAEVNSVDGSAVMQKISIVDHSHDGLQYTQQGLPLDAQIRKAVASAIVENVGDRHYWPTWGRKAGDVYQSVCKHLDERVANDQRTAKAVAGFAKSMRKTAIPTFTDKQARGMICQHIVTMPIFDAFFGESRFADLNPISQHIETVARRLRRAGVEFDRITADIDDIYDRIRQAIELNPEPADRVDMLRKVYEGFLTAALDDVVKRLGIVYTPTPIVDFMLRSVDAVCHQEFGKGLTDEDVTILDPFTGTGTFLARLLTITGADGNPLIADADVARKYRDELWASEIVMLPYYLAALQIEESAAARGAFDTSQYEPFGGIVLADTFEMVTSAMLRSRKEHVQQAFELGVPTTGNVERLSEIEEKPIRVIVTNPPWSAGQKSAGDDNPRADYDHVAKRVRDTYGERQQEVTGKSAGGNAAGNLYVQAFRWATDRLAPPGDKPGDEGWVVAFVHPNSLINATSLAGMRAALRDEFTSVYVIDLRGDAYKSGKEFRLEGDKIFGGGSRNGVAITVAVRNPEADQSRPASLRLAQVPVASTLEDKFSWLNELGDATSGNLNEVPITARHDWVNIGDGSFDHLCRVCDTDKSNEEVAVASNASGVKTNCDDYVYSFSREELEQRVRRLIDAYEQARQTVHPPPRRRAPSNCRPRRASATNRPGHGQRQPGRDQMDRPHEDLAEAQRPHRVRPCPHPRGALPALHQAVALRGRPHPLQRQDRLRHVPPGS